MIIIFVNLSIEWEEKTGNWRLIFLLWILQKNRVENTQKAELRSGRRRSEWGGWVGGVGRNIPSIVNLNPSSKFMAVELHSSHTSQAAASSWSSPWTWEHRVSQNSSYDKLHLRYPGGDRGTQVNRADYIAGANGESKILYKEPV